MFSTFHRQEDGIIHLYQQWELPHDGSCLQIPSQDENCNYEEEWLPDRNLSSALKWWSPPYPSNWQEYYPQPWIQASDLQNQPLLCKLDGWVGPKHNYNQTGGCPVWVYPSDHHLLGFEPARHHIKTFTWNWCYASPWRNWTIEHYGCWQSCSIRNTQKLDWVNAANATEEHWYLSIIKIPVWDKHDGCLSTH